MRKDRFSSWGLAVVALFGCAGAQAITVQPFGSRGQGGDLNGQNFTIGTGGQVHQLDAFVYIQGLDLNGSLLGSTAQLSRDSLPNNLTYQFSFALSADAADIVLTYSLTNNSGATFNDVRFFVLLDAEIDAAINTLFNEYGTVQGSPGAGGSDPAPFQWQIDEPGFQTGTLVRNLYLGTLDNSNSVPATALNDVAMSLGFSFGNLQPGDGASVRVMISEAQHQLGTFALTQHDADPASTTVITMSGLRGQGQQVTAQLNGTIFRDVNGNGAPDPGEGISGAVLLLQSNQVTVAQATTDSTGRYSLTNVPGTYSLRLDTTSVPPGLLLVPVQSGATNNPWNVVLTPDGVSTVNWGFTPPPMGQVTGTIFQDFNTNGLPDAGEPLRGVRLLLQSNQVIVAETTTDGTGTYGFTNVPGNYLLQLDTSSLPSGLVQVPVQSGATNNPWNVSITANATAMVNWGFRGVTTNSFVNVNSLLSYALTWQLNRARGTLVGTLMLTNLPGSATLRPPWQLGMPASSNFFYPTNFGTAVIQLPDGNAGVDLSAEMARQSSQGQLGSGQFVILTNAVEIYSLTRGAPPDSQFEVWASR